MQISTPKWWTYSMRGLVSKIVCTCINFHKDEFGTVRSAFFCSFTDWPTKRILHPVEMFVIDAFISFLDCISLRILWSQKMIAVGNFSLYPSGENTENIDNCLMIDVRTPKPSRFPSVCFPCRLRYHLSNLFIYVPVFSKMNFMLWPKFRTYFFHYWRLPT